MPPRDPREFYIEFELLTPDNASYRPNMGVEVLIGTPWGDREGQGDFVKDAKYLRDAAAELLRAAEALEHAQKEVKS